ncbi:MAG: hypothetical protein AB1428_12960 [Bacteroidota bacterium]
MTRFIAEYVDRQSRRRACYVDIDEGEKPDARDSAVRKQIEKLSPHFIRVVKYYRAPANTRGKL